MGRPVSAPRGLRQRLGSMVGRLGASLAGASFGVGFEGAMQNRRLSGFRPSQTSLNSMLVLAGPTLRARARHLVRNNPYARKAQRVFVSHLVGTGIRPVPKLKDAALKSAIAELWEDWTDEADADGLTDLYGLQVLAARAMFEAGECFARFRPRRPADGLVVPFQVQLLESEFCPYELNRVEPNGNETRSGIEFDAIGRRVAYWFWKRHPGETALPGAVNGYTRVPADEVVHLFEPLRPGQIRGVSWLMAAIVRAYILDQYDDAELERKKTAALFAGFIYKQSNDPNAPLGAPSTEDAAAGAALDDPQEQRQGLSPGMLQVLFPGEDIKFAEPADVGGNFEAFQYRALLAMCAAMDLPYGSVTGDISKATYASSRAALLDLRAAVEQIQHTVMVFQFCRQTWRRFMTDAVLAGALPIKAAAFNRERRAFLRCKWIPPRFPWIDPLKDVMAEKAAVRAGFRSRADVVAAQGYDLEEMDAEIEAGNRSADSHGLVLDSDARHTDGKGSAKPRADGAAPAEDALVETAETADTEEAA